MADIDFDEKMRRSLVGAWQEYLAALDPIRPDLFRYCRKLTGDLWDAEDLVQETLLKAFARLSHILYAVKSRRAYVLRIATNLWMDRLRGRTIEEAALAMAARTESTVAAVSAPTSQSAEVREAAAILMQRLAPQERVAVLLVEIFEVTLEEAASILGTTIGATKSALHRGRERLKEADPTGTHRRPKPSRELVDRFVERYNARDLPGLLGLMRDDASIEMYGLEVEIGRDGFERERGWFHHNFYNPFDGSPARARWEVAILDEEPVVLVFGGFADESVLTSAMRLEEREGSVARIDVYALCPDVVRELGSHFGHPTQSIGYRFPLHVGIDA